MTTTQSRPTIGIRPEVYKRARKAADLQGLKLTLLVEAMLAAWERLADAQRLQHVRAVGDRRERTTRRQN